jgi:hypothetical protein
MVEGCGGGALWMDVAFDKKQDAFLNMPSWRSVLDAKPIGDMAKPAVKLD